MLLLRRCAFLALVLLPQLSGGAVPSGTLRLYLVSDPPTLNPITAIDGVSGQILAYLFESMLRKDGESQDWRPALAASWEETRKGVTFRLRSGSKWSDGQPITASDVKFSFDHIFDDRYPVSFRRSGYEGVREAVVKDAQTIEFRLGEKPYFKTFEALAELRIVPKHVYEISGKEEEGRAAKLAREPVGSGAYRLESWTRGQTVVLSRRSDYWGDQAPDSPSSKEYRFAKLYFRVIPERAVVFQTLSRGELDLIGLQPSEFVSNTKGEGWGSRLLAIQCTNESPDLYGFGFIGWNLERPLFRERATRQALSHLFNRELMIQKIDFGLFEPATGPFGNRSPASSPRVKPVEYSPKKALALLKSAGWQLTSSGLVRKRGETEERFSFTVRVGSDAHDRYLGLFQEDLRKVGIEMKIEKLEWGAFVKNLDSRDFDALCLAWSGIDPEPDPHSIWHSASIAAPGHNFVSYRNSEVDAWIDAYRASLKPKERLKLIRKIHEKIAEDQPYSFLFNKKYTLYARSAALLAPKDCQRYRIGSDLWSLRPN